MSKVYKSIKIEPSIVEEPALLYLSLSQMQGASSFGIDKLIQAARSGVSMSFLTKLADRLALSLQDMGDILHISLRTLQRYTAHKKLDTDASAKLLNLTALEVHGVAVFGDRLSFVAWLKTPVMALGDKTPLSYLDTPFGFQLVDQMLGRIEHGIFA